MSHESDLSSARAAGDTDRIAELLVKTASELVEAGRMSDARRRLDEAAGLHQNAGRSIDQARCLVFAATLCRADGKLDQAHSRASRAEGIAPAATPAAVSAATELGEIALAQQQFSVAADCYRRALDHGVSAGLIDAAQAVLLRKRAHALAGSGDAETAAGELERSIERYLAGGEDSEARRTRIELATALEAAGRAADADRVIATLADDAEAAGDAWVLADLALLAASRALDDGDAAAAREHTERARSHALDAVHPVAYVSAAITLAELAEADGDRVGAYEALAVGWATLGDLLGEDAAKATFAPRLEAQRERWGDDAFAAARDDYYARRRAALKG